MLSSSDVQKEGGSVTKGLELGSSNESEPQTRKIVGFRLSFSNLFVRGHGPEPMFSRVVGSTVALREVFLRPETHNISSFKLGAAPKNTMQKDRLGA